MRVTSKLMILIVRKAHIEVFIVLSLLRFSGCGEVIVVGRSIAADVWRLCELNVVARRLVIVVVLGIWRRRSGHSLMR